MRFCTAVFTTTPSPRITGAAAFPLIKRLRT